MKSELLILAEFPEEICWLGNEILRQKAESLTQNEIKEGKAAEITKRLEITLKKIQKLGKGVAIAAPQIGISKAIIIIYLEDRYIPFINPVITTASENKNSFPEGCLSSLPLVAETIRPAEIDVKYLDAEGKEHLEHFDGKMARMLQHEVDHLNGILFIDRANLKTGRFIADWDEYKETAQLTEI